MLANGLEFPNTNWKGLNGAGEGGLATGGNPVEADGGVFAAAAAAVGVVGLAGAPAVGGLAKGWALPNTKEKGLMGSAPDAPVTLPTDFTAVFADFTAVTDQSISENSVWDIEKQDD